MYRKLSYNLTLNDPVFPGNPKSLKIHPFTRIANGDISNQSRLTIFNHDGTHVDGPKHFNNGSSVELSAVDINRFIFTTPSVIDLEGKVQEKIFPQDIEPFANTIEGADFLLIRTGYSTFRNHDHHKYTQNYPVFSQEVAAYFVENFDTLVGVGVDCIAVGSMKFPEDAVKTHQILNGMNVTGKYLLILEDVNIPKDVKSMQKLFVIPLFVETVDSLPVTVFCEI